jgi:hypothetical protein
MPVGTIFAVVEWVVLLLGVIGFSRYLAESFNIQFMKNQSLTWLSFACLCLLAGCKKDTVTSYPPAPVVNAGSPQTIVLPIDSVTLSGEARDSISKIVAYLWSEVSGPNVPVIASEGSKTTLVSGLTEGLYVFQLMAVDSLGETGVDTVSVTVNPRITDTLVLSGSKEQTFLSDSTNYQNGNPPSPELLAETWTISAERVVGRSFFSFDLAPGVPVKSARLTLYSDTIPQNGDLVHANYGTANDFYIQRVGSAWTESTSTNWLNLPATDTTAEVHIPQTSQSFLNLVNVDVTTLVNNMIVSGNYGFEIRLNNEVLYNSRIFCSGNYPDQSRRPRLIVSY